MAVYMHAFALKKSNEYIGFFLPNAWQIFQIIFYMSNAIFLIATESIDRLGSLDIVV